VLFFELFPAFFLIVCAIIGILLVVSHRRATRGDGDDRR
jgi:hypothetical protein